MTHLEITDLLNKQVAALWPKWEVTPELIDLYAETFQRYSADDVLKAFRRHKAEQDFQEPKIPHVVRHLRVVIGERKAEERKRETGPEWPGQVFVVAVHNPAGETVRLFDFHIPNPRAQVPREFESYRMQQHIDEVSETRMNQYPDCRFSGEIHTDESWHRRKTAYDSFWRLKTFQSTPGVGLTFKDARAAVLCGVAASEEAPW